MKSYTGTKTLNAQPMTRVSYNAMRGWTMPADENGADEGYLVEYTDGGKANHPDFEGYISWSPKEQFERAYVENADTAIEREIVAKGLTAPRVTPADVKDNIVSEHYFTAAQGDRQEQDDECGGRSVQLKDSPLHVLTFCVLVLRNGFTVTGESACASPENFDAKIGRKNARENAVQKIWPLLGFLLKEKLYVENS